MINQLIPDIKRMIKLSERRGELRVEYRQAAEIKRGKMPDEKRLAEMRKMDEQLFQELKLLSEKWGVSEKKY